MQGCQKVFYIFKHIFSIETQKLEQEMEKKQKIDEKTEQEKAKKIMKQ